MHIAFVYLWYINIVKNEDFKPLGSQYVQIPVDLRHICTSAVNFFSLLYEMLNQLVPLKKNISFCLADSERGSSEAQWKAVIVLSYHFSAICSFTQLK